MRRGKGNLFSTAQSGAPVPHTPGNLLTKQIMPSLMDRFDPATRSRLRRHLLARGQKLATLLADVLAGKGNIASVEALVLLRPGIRPEEALRKALDQVEARRILLDRDDDRFGRCDICATDLGVTALIEMPWADRCAAHAGV